jgi:hypothetical protein
VVQSGYIGDSAVLSGNIGSGQIGIIHLASGTVEGLIGSGSVTSGDLGIGAVNNINIASGTVSFDKMASGAFLSITDPDDNRIVTSLASGSNQITGESNLTFNGSVFTFNGASGTVFSAQDLTLTSGNLINVSSGTFTVSSYGYTQNTAAKYTGQTASFPAFVLPDTLADGAFFEYVAIETGTGARRAGTVVCVWNAAADTADYLETSTMDLGGSTTGLSFSVAIASNVLTLTANITAGTWTIKLSARVTE